MYRDQTFSAYIAQLICYFLTMCYSYYIEVRHILLSSNREIQMNTNNKYVEPQVIGATTYSMPLNKYEDIIDDIDEGDCYE